jgi:aspartyl/asparaginyl beta-hydroxylase (cupin superfamily)
MSGNPIDARAITAAGFEALQRGDLEAARASFGRATSVNAADSRAWFGLSLVHRRAGAHSEESDALDQALRLDPRHLPALIAKGDLYTRLGDQRAANSYYSAVLKIAASLRSVPAELQSELRRIDAACQGFARDFEAHLLAALATRGLGGPGTERFVHAIDLLLGKRQIYFQQPKYFFFPELPQIQFYDRRQFPWAEALERETDAIRAEVRAILAAGAGFAPYIQREPNRPVFDNKGLLNNTDWGACYLIQDGAEVPENAARCPRTMAALREVPLCRIEGRTPSVLFSLLRPGARIPPHHGFMNTRLICHLPLIVPPKCGLRVGNETGAWREGELMVFDDSIEHEAWNSSTELRVVLLFDIWRPELPDAERALVAGMLEAIDSYGGPRQKWSE